MKTRIISVVILFAIVCCSHISSSETMLEELEAKLEAASGQERAVLLNELAQAYQQESPENALKYGQEALEAAREYNDATQEAIALEHIGMSLYAEEKYDMALNYFQQSHEQHYRIENKKGMASSLHKIGLIYHDKNSYTQALEYCSQALQIYEEIDAREDMTTILHTIGAIYTQNKEYDKAISSYQRTLTLARETGNTPILQEVYRNLAELYFVTGDIKQGKEYYDIYETLLKDHHRETLAALQEQRDFETQEWQQERLGNQKRVKSLEFRQRLLLIVLFLIMCVLGGVSAFGIYHRRRQTERSQADLAKAKARSEELLHNVLPVSIARDLQKSGTTEPKAFEHVTVCFCDVFEFTKLSASLDPKLLLTELNTLFTAFDEIIEGNDCERLKTVGDAYLYVCGMPDENSQHAERVVRSALEILQYLAKRNQYAKIHWQIQVGIHTGRLIGGVVGIKKYVYDVFGDTINIASAVKNASEPMRINISETTYDHISERFQCADRGQIKIKGKGMMNVYFVEKEIQFSLDQDEDEDDILEIPEA